MAGKSLILVFLFLLSAGRAFSSTTSDSSEAAAPPVVGPESVKLAGTACDPVTGLACVKAATDSTIQSQIQAEQTKINKDTSIVKFYPVFTIGMGFRF